MTPKASGSGKLTRRAALSLPPVLLATLYGCGKKSELPAVFPETLSGGWRRTSLREASPSEAPDPVPAQSIKQLQLADYEGAGKIRARMYALGSSAAALDVVQRWRPSADTVFFHDREYVVAVSWQDADRAAVREFVRDVEKRLAPEGRKRQESSAE
jgi:hypothetical protein